MLIPQLTKYILEELERGNTELAIKQKLFQTHWMPEEIEENYEYAVSEAKKLLGQYKTKKVRKKGKNTLITAMILFFLALLIAIIFFIYIVITTWRKDASQQLVIPQIVSPQPETTHAPLITIVNQTDRRRDNDRITIQDNLVKYYEDTQAYPERLSELVPAYISELPKDPDSGNQYKYEQISEGQDYKLCVTYTEVGEACFNRLSN